jgi:dolichol-phosphate mannosyltransferase
MNTSLPTLAAPHIAVVIPCFKVEPHIVEVIKTIPPSVSTIVVVDDKSPDNFVAKVRALQDSRLVLIRHETNQGVGGAMVTGYQECLRRNVDIAVKMDGDGQMDPAYLPALLRPLLRGEADYSKGNRWHDLNRLASMPAVRRRGSVILSFLTKLTSGYWRLFDPCNGYTAIRTCVLRLVPLEQLSKNFFFETSLLVQLNVLGAVIRDVGVPARYGNEKSTMSISRVLKHFPLALFRSWKYRLWQRYFVRDFGAVSLCLLGGAALTGWGLAFGGWKWLQSIFTGVPNTAGTVMLAALPFLMGFQLLLQAALLEVVTEPTRPLSQDEPLGQETAPPQSYREAA